ncbi:hypothetical protein SteCoe_2213 [Stentor coeruleus]|uniref:Uncharacterized protein n=1 Tax=Stentor coeruleus TaxID=5963 RepID=A0A1R2CZY0_9CILI|nr:hypothetical protein SteCoe_2213 [Stentor coeruleus]
MSDPLIFISQLLSKLTKNEPEPLNNEDILPLKNILKIEIFFKLKALSSLGLIAKDEIIELLLNLYEEIFLSAIQNMLQESSERVHKTGMVYQHNNSSLDSGEQTFSFGKSLQLTNSLPEFKGAEGALKLKN